MIWYGDRKTSRAAFVRRLRWLEPNKELRESWQYNNLMYLTAGYLAGQLTEKSWEEALRVEVLDRHGATAAKGLGQCAGARRLGRPRPSCA